MPRGAKPKVYPPDLVAEVTHLYTGGLTIQEVADRLALHHKVIWNLMRRHGIERRVAAKRSQRGQQNSSWRGDAAGYQAMHLRVESARGKPARCDTCGTTEPSKTYEWANLTGAYQDVDDYRRMCRSCHRLYDNARRGEA